MADKRYPASQKKLKKAREDGDVAKSRDLTSSASLVIGTAILVMGVDIFEKISSLFNKTL